MRQLYTEISFGELKERIGQKINKHLVGLDKSKKDENQKILELCQIGKLICSYFTDFEITKVSERPDFVISNDKITVGLEHQLILDSEPNQKKAFIKTSLIKLKVT